MSDSSTATASTDRRTRTRRAKVVLDTENRKVQFIFLAPNGAPDGREFFAELDVMPANIREHLALAGLAEKLRDTYADPSTDPYEAVADVYEALTKGVWTQRGERGEANTVLMLAYAKALGKEPEAIKEAFTKLLASEAPKDKALLGSIRQHPRVVAIMAEIAIERAKARLEKAQSNTTERDLPGLV